MGFRALRLDHGNFAWGSEHCTRKTRLLDVMYNATSSELVRTKTLTKNTVIQIDAQPFKQWYLKYYNIDLGKKKLKAGQKEKEKDPEKEAEPEVKRSRHVIATCAHRAAKQKLDPMLEDQFQSGRLFACVASRPGQCGRCDGYILEGEELAFYKKKMEK